MDSWASTDPSEFRICMAVDGHVLAPIQMILMASKPWEPLASEFSLPSLVTTHK